VTDPHLDRTDGDPLGERDHLQVRIRRDVDVGSRVDDTLPPSIAGAELSE
jgi:hypothetical protein